MTETHRPTGTGQRRVGVSGKRGPTQPAPTDGTGIISGLADPDASEPDTDQAALRGEVLPLGNSVLEDIQGTFG